MVSFARVFAPAIRAVSLCDACAILNEVLRVQRLCFFDNDCAAELALRPSDYHCPDFLPRLSRKRDWMRRLQIMAPIVGRQGRRMTR